MAIRYLTCSRCSGRGFHFTFCDAKPRPPVWEEVADPPEKKPAGKKKA